MSATSLVTKEAHYASATSCSTIPMGMNATWLDGSGQMLGLAHALSCRDGQPAASASLIRALKRYFASVDPDEFNGASRVAFVWAFTIAPEPDVGIPESTDTEQYVDVYFWADGDRMVAAGSIAPGFSSSMMSLSRSSPAEKWHVDGFWMP
jgi:hypothetical protein